MKKLILCLSMVLLCSLSHGDSGNGINGSCQLRVSGNFFFPDSQIDCNVWGFGAVGYDVVVDGYIRWRDGLDAGDYTQDFLTDKKKVGGYDAEYAVWIYDISGEKTCIFTHP